MLALKALGAQFSAYVTIQPHHRLIRHGIYARIRHPLYLSLLLLPVGIALVFNSELAALPLIMSVAFIWDRTRKEDYNLAAHFGSQFEDYRRQTPAILPWKIQ